MGTQEKYTDTCPVWVWGIHRYKKAAKSCTPSGEFGYLLVYEMGFLPSWFLQDGGLFLVFANTSTVETENYLNMNYYYYSVADAVEIKVLMIILQYENGEHVWQYLSQYCTVTLKSMNFIFAALWLFSVLSIWSHSHSCPFFTSCLGGWCSSTVAGSFHCSLYL